MQRTALLALALASTAGAARSNDSAWSSLDAEVEALAQALRQEDSPIVLGGLIRVIGAQSSQNISFMDGAGDDSTADLGGVVLDSVRVDARGELADWAWFVEGETTAGNLNLLDGWVRHTFPDLFTVTLGQFRPPFLGSGLMYRGNLLFLARTRNGGLLYSRRDQGVMLEREFDDLHLFLAVQNGVDSVSDDVNFTSRVTWDVLGNGVGETEGAYGAGQGTHATLGLAVTDEGSAPNDGLAIAAEASATINRFSMQAEWIDYERDYDLLSGPGRPLGVEPPIGNTHPYSLTGSAMIMPDKLEFAARVDEFDDEGGLNRTLTTFGLNFYIEGHDLKWQLNYSHLDRIGGDLEIASIGLTAQI